MDEPSAGWDAGCMQLPGSNAPMQHVHSNISRGMHKTPGLCTLQVHVQVWGSERGSGRGLGLVGSAETTRAEYVV